MIQSFEQENKSEIKSFLTLEGEKLIAYKRQHWLVLIGPIILTALTLLSISLVAAYLIIYLSHNLFLTASTVLLMLTVLTLLITKIVIDWQHHLYIITTRKIIEVCCSPLFSDRINDVFLDQVRTTEVSAKMNTILHEMFDFGDVVIAFDRPSKEEVFILNNIGSPRETSSQIGDALEDLMHGSHVWFQKGESLGQQKYVEDVFKKSSPTAEVLDELLQTT